jgi:hypothetical protein
MPCFVLFIVCARQWFLCTIRLRRYVLELHASFLSAFLSAGNLVGLVLSPLILMQFGWKALFYTFGLLGLPLLAVWLAVAPNPNKAAAAAADSSSSEEASSSSSKGEAVSVWKLLSHKATWAIIVVNIVNHWGYFIYLNWMPSYFVKVRMCHNVVSYCCIACCVAWDFEVSCGRPLPLSFGHADLTAPGFWLRVGAAAQNICLLCHCYLNTTCSFATVPC